VQHSLQASAYILANVVLRPKHSFDLRLSPKNKLISTLHQLRNRCSQPTGQSFLLLASSTSCQHTLQHPSYMPRSFPFSLYLSHSFIRAWMIYSFSSHSTSCLHGGYLQDRGDATDHQNPPLVVTRFPIPKSFHIP
jgi:hypothetical protein